MSFIELFDFIIYQHRNKRTNILPLATSQIAHLCNQFNHVCTANFLATFLKALFFNQNSPKMKLFCKKRKIFERWGLCPQTPVPPAAGGFAPKPPASGGWGLRPQTPIGRRRLGAPPPDSQNSPPIANFWLRAWKVVGNFK